jgi:hypothetical protein
MATGKYDPVTLIRMFRMAAKLRNQMLAAGFTDNGGAIHSAERILDILGQRLKYPGLSHISGLKRHKGAVFSSKARQAHQQGGKVVIEHVSPLRALTQRTIDRVSAGDSDEKLMAFVKRRYRLALLTPEEMGHLNRINRSHLHGRRLKQADIVLEE